MFKRLLLYGLLAGLILFLAVGTGNASMVDPQVCASGLCSQTGYATIAGTNWGIENPAATLTFNRFDQTLGTLSLIRVILSATSSVSGTATATDAPPGVDPDTQETLPYAGVVSDFTYTTDIWLNDPDGNQIDQGIPSYTWGATTLPTGAHTENFAAQESSDSGTAVWHATAFQPVTFVGNADAYVSDSIVGATYQWDGSTGPSTIDFDLWGYLTYSATFPSGYNGGVAGSSDTTITLQYEYSNTPESVPEPVTMGLCGAGLVALAVFGRKRFVR